MMGNTMGNLQLSILTLCAAGAAASQVQLDQATGTTSQGASHSVIGDSWLVDDTVRVGPGEGDLPPATRGWEVPPEAYVPVPMPDTASARTGQTPDAGQAVYHDLVTGETFYYDLDDIPADSPLHGLEPGSFPGLQDASHEEGSFGRSMTDLTIVNTPEAWPWSANTKLFMRFDRAGGGSPSYRVCSATMIDPKHVLTAGHCIYTHDILIAGWADSVTVVPGYDGGIEPYGRGTASGIWSWSAWTDSENYEYDMGVMVLDRPVGGLSGWYGYGFNSGCSFFEDNTFYNYSYPAESAYGWTGEWMYGRYGDFDNCYGSNRKQVNRAGYGGMSGSSAYDLDGGNRYAYAVASTSDRVSSTTYCSLWSSGFYWIRDTLIPGNTPTSLDFWGMKTESYNTIALGGNQLIDFSYSVHNYSDDAFNGTVYVSVYLSTNDTISTADTYLGQYGFNWNTGPKGTATLTYDTIAPYIPSDTPSGEYFLGVIVDNADLTSSNNDSSGQDAHPIFVIARPELDVRSVNVQNGQHCVGEQMPVDFTVQNWGGANVSSWTARVKMSLDTNITDSDWTVGTFNYGALNAGATVNRSESITVPSFVSGPWYVGVIIETSSGEILYSNNTNYDRTPITVAFCPDLDVVSVDAPDSGIFHSNDIMPITTRIRNNGYSTDDSMNIHYYASTNTTITESDYHLGWAQVDTPFAGQFDDLQVNVGFPTMPDGEYYIGVIVTTNDETDPSDNTGYDPVRITYAGDPCGVDLNNDGTLDVFDILEFLGMFEQQTRGADWNRDGIYDVFDVLAFLADFDAGC